MSNDNNSELKEIIEGFNLFGSEKDGVINPKEVKEIMEIMNMNEKNPFLYNIIKNLCSNEEIQKKGGINAEDFISLLDTELDDISSIEGLQKIFSIFSDVNNNTICLSNISQILKENKDLGLGQDEEKIKKLLSKPEISGKEIEFNDFKNFMNVSKEKNNFIYVKKSNPNSNNNNYKKYEKEIISNNINNIQDSSPSHYSKNELENNFGYNDNEMIKEEEINNNQKITDLNYDDNINNFDNIQINNKLKSKKSEKKIKLKKKYRPMHESPKNKSKNKNEEMEINHQGGKIINNISQKNENSDEFEEIIQSNIEYNINISKEDKSKKNYYP